MPPLRLAAHETHGSTRLPRAFRVFTRARRAERRDYDRWFAHPDMVEDDYYRFLKYPRD